LIKRKTCKRQYVHIEETLIVNKEGSSYKDSKTPAKRVRAERRCSCCSEIRHNSYTFKVEIKDIDNSNASE
ncbi:uncharacterized protein M421DRAFT_71068, partial [Didymella exigua CBS 183.55]